MPLFKSYDVFVNRENLKQTYVELYFLCSKLKFKPELYLKQFLENSQYVLAREPIFGYLNISNMKDTHVEQIFHFNYGNIPAS